MLRSDFDKFPYRGQDKVRDAFEPAVNEAQNVESESDRNRSNSSTIEVAQESNEEIQSVPPRPGNVITVSDEASALSPGITSLFPSYQGATFTFDGESSQI